MCFIHKSHAIRVGNNFAHQNTKINNSNRQKKLTIGFQIISSPNILTFDFIS